MFFPGADHWKTETRILSGRRLELEKMLGRPPPAEANALKLNRVYGGRNFAGTILTRRAKGEYGAIEIILAVSADNAIRGVRLQRLREPPAVAEALSSAQWLGAFSGRTLGSGWDAKVDFPALAAPAEVSGAAVADAVRSLLVLLVEAEQTKAPKTNGPHH